MYTPHRVWIEKRLRNGSGTSRETAEFRPSPRPALLLEVVNDRGESHFHRTRHQGGRALPVLGCPKGRRFPRHSILKSPVIHKNPGPDTQKINDEKLIFRHFQKRGHPFSMKQEKINFSIVDIFFIQVARVARGGDAAPSFHPNAPLICIYFK